MSYRASASSSHSLTGQGSTGMGSSFVRPSYAQPSPSSSKTTTYKQADIKVASVTQDLGVGAAVTSSAYGGASYGRYMPWYWLLWVFLVPAVCFAIFLTFPPSFVMECGPNNTQVVNMTKVFGLSVFVGWFIVLIFWFIAAWC